MLKSCGIDSLLPDTISTGYERIWHFFFCILNGKSNPKLTHPFCFRHQICIKMERWQPWPWLYSSYLNWALLFGIRRFLCCCTCIPKFHLRNRQCIFWFSLRFWSHSDKVRNKCLLYQVSINLVEYIRKHLAKPHLVKSIFWNLKCNITKTEGEAFK